MCLFHEREEWSISYDTQTILWSWSSLILRLEGKEKGIHLSCLPRIESPLLTFHQRPLERICLPYKILCQPQKGKPLFGLPWRKWTLRILAIKEFGPRIILHSCLARRAMLKLWRSLKPIPPLLLVCAYKEIQCSLRTSPSWLHQKFEIKEFDSWQKEANNLKQDIT